MLCCIIIAPLKVNNVNDFLSFLTSSCRSAIIAVEVIYMAELYETPKGNRIHIGIFGRRNAGKSSIINAITGQSLAIVSDVKGTTTDPVEKAMELLPLGPVVIIDTPGLDDVGELGSKRIEKAYQVLRKTDIALLVADAGEGLGEEENKLVEEFKARGIAYVIAYNKTDISGARACSENAICVSAKNGEGIGELKEMLARIVPQSEERRLIGDLLEEGDVVVLVVPIDAAAPKGRLILPQQQTIRDVLESGATAVVCRDTELKQTLAGLTQPPKLVVTDSQAFGRVSKETPLDILMTSFSILFARYKGELAELIKGVKAIENLQDGDRVLIAEGCTHHRQCGDIGSVKIPKWLEEFTGKKPVYEFASGTGFPRDLNGYKAIIHCGGCMLNEREMKFRIKTAAANGIPIVNYGILIAHVHGILKRSLEPFEEIMNLFD